MIWSFLWAIVVGFLYLIPGHEVPAVDFWDFFEVDKLAHVSVFSLLTLFLKVGFMRQQVFAKLREHSTLYALTSGWVYGTTLEIIQGQLIDGRYTEGGDFIANALGCLLGIVIYRIIYSEGHARLIE